MLWALTVMNWKLHLLLLHHSLYLKLILTGTIKYANESKGSEPMDFCSVGDGDDEDISSDEDEDLNDPVKSSSDEGLNESGEW